VRLCTGCSTFEGSNTPSSQLLQAAADAPGTVADPNEAAVVVCFALPFAVHNNCISKMFI
jgi:hypothetical protein